MKLMSSNCSTWLLGGQMLSQPTGIFQSKVYEPVPSLGCSIPVDLGKTWQLALFAGNWESSTFFLLKTQAKLNLSNGEVRLPFAPEFKQQNSSSNAEVAEATGGGPACCTLRNGSHIAKPCGSGLAVCLRNVRQGFNLCATRHFWTKSGSAKKASWVGWIRNGSDDTL